VCWLAGKVTGFAAAIAGLVIVLTLTGCPQTTATTGSHTAVTNSSSNKAPEVGGPTAIGNASVSGPGVVGAGSFPRSFQVPGTDTSIRVGGE
jgi:hypothetical protein